MKAIGTCMGVPVEALLPRVTTYISYRNLPAVNTARHGLEACGGSQA